MKSYEDLLDVTGRQNEPSVASLDDVEKALGRRARGILEELRDGSAQLAKAYILRRARLLDITKEPYRDDDWREIETAKAYATAQAEVDRLARRFDSLKEELDSIIAGAFTGPQDSSTRLVWLTEEANAWRRAEPILTNTDAPLQMLERLIVRGGAVMARTLRAELPAWFDARGGAENGMTKAALDIITAAEEPFLTDAQKTARRVEAEVKDGWPRLRLAVTYANHALQSGDGGWVLPMWEGVKRTIAL